MKPALWIIAFSLCLASVPVLAQTPRENAAIVAADRQALMEALATVEADAELLKTDQAVGYQGAIQPDMDKLAADRQVLEEATQKLNEDKKALHVTEKGFDDLLFKGEKEIGYIPSLP